MHKRKDWNRRKTKRPTENHILSIIPIEAPGISAKEIERQVPVAKKTIRTILGNLLAEGTITKTNPQLGHYYRRTIQENHNVREQ